MSKRKNIKAAPGETAYDKEYSQDPAVKRPAVKAPVKPKVEKAESDEAETASTSPQVSLREDAENSDAHLAEPLKYIVSPTDAIEKVETLLQKVKEGRPDLMQQVDTILKQVDQLEQGAQGANFPAHEAAEAAVPGQVEPGEEMDQELSPGASVEVQAEEEIYHGILVDMNEDGTWDVQTDQNMVLSAVPAEAIRVVQAETFMSLPASLQLMQIKILGLKSAQSLQGLDLEEFLASKSPEELAELVAQWKARIAEVGPALEDSAFIQNAIARAEELNNEKHMPMAASKKEPTMKIKAEVEAGYTETPTKVVDEKGVVRLFNPETDDTQPLTIYQNTEGKLAAVAEDGSAEYEDKANDDVEIKFFQDVHGLMGQPAAEELPVAASAAEDVLKQKLGAGRKSMLTTAKRADLKARLKKVTASKKELAMKKPAVVVPVIEASAFDKIPELDLGDGFKVRRKAGEKKPKDGAAPEAPKADAKPADDKMTPGGPAAPESPIPTGPKMPLGANLKAADFPPKEDKPEDKKEGEEKPKDEKSPEDKPKDDKGEDKPKDKKDEKFDGPMLEIIDKDGKVVTTVPDAFGDDTVSIIKFLQQVVLPEFKKGEKKDEKKDGDKKDDKEKGEKKEEKKDDEKLEDKPKALPAVKVDKKDEEGLKASMKLMEERISMVRNIVKGLADKHYIVADQRDIDEELLKQETGKESLEAAMNAAFDRASDRKFREILAMPDAELLTLRASLPSMSIKATQLEITASQEGLEPLDLLTVQASKAASAGEVSIGSAFGFSSFSK